MKLAIPLGALLLASACGMGEGEHASARQDPSWFEYAYYSSAATLEADGMVKDNGRGGTKPLKLGYY